MKPEYKVVVLSVIFFVAINLTDAVMGSFFTHGTSFWGALIADVPPHVMFHRSVITACFLVFGLIVSKDFANRRRLENALRESEHFFRALFENSRDAVLICDAKTGVVLDANDQAALTIRLERKKILGMRQSEFFPSGKASSYAKLIMENVQTNGSSPVSAEILTGDGKTIPVEINAGTVELASGQTVIQHIIRDITERKWAEYQLRTSEEKMRLVIESSPIGIAIVQQGSYQYINPEFIHMFGCETADNILGLPLEQLYVEEERELIQYGVTQVVEGKLKIFSHDATALKAEGRSFPVLLRFTRIDLKGTPALLGFFVDVSEERALRTQLLQAQKLEAIGTLAGGIAHDFNNLLTVVSGYTELLLMDTSDNACAHADLEKIAAAAQKGADLVRRVLAFSRKAETRLGPLNLNSEVEQVRKMLSRTLPRMIEIRLDLADDLKTVCADSAQINQVLMNLAVNARDAMPDGGYLTIQTENLVLDEAHCKTQLRTVPGDYVLLSLSDTGQGMDENTVKRIFEPFFTTKDPGKGTGLGLAMVHGIVESHGGHITCQSEPGKGTTFRIYLPVMKEIEEGKCDTGERTAPVGGTETILVVDDEESIRDLGTRLLSHAGYSVLCASNGKEALEIYRKQDGQVRLVLLDLIMPEMGGKQCLEELVRIDPGVKVLITSGHTPDEPTKEFVEGKAKGFVVKPYKTVELLKAVRDELDRK